MEEVENANSAAVESCFRVINLLSQPQTHNHYRNLAEQTGDAVNKFKKVVSILNSSCGHARVRKFKKIQPPFPQNIFLENQITRTDDQHPKPRPPIQINHVESNPLQELGSSVKSALSLELSSNARNLPQVAQQMALPNHQFLQQQQQRRIQLQQQAEVMYRCNNSSGISLNFDGSTCTPTMSSTRSFISSLSVDGSVANLDGSAFHLIGSSQSADQGSYHHKRRCSGRGEDGSVKCGGNGRCRCSKKRCLIFACLSSCSIELYSSCHLKCFVSPLNLWPLFCRKHRVKTSIKVPAISNKLADIPPDEYSWRKYGQKPIKGSPHPRYSLVFSSNIFSFN